MTDEQQLPEPLLWGDDGHASDLVITTLADGERDIVPLGVFAHVHSCTSCGDRLGQAALLACQVDEALQLPAEAMAAEGALDGPLSGGEISRPRRLPLPIPALGVALGLAALGAAPNVLDLSQRLPELLGAAAIHVPMVLRTLWLVLRGALTSGGPAVTAAWCVAAVVLLLMGTWITRLLPLKAQAKGDVR